MKTIKSTDNQIIRVDDETAEIKVKGGWSYVPKQEWKTSVRDIKKKQNKKTEDNESDIPAEKQYKGGRQKK